ncbi:MAG TPA: glycosyltransferase family 39 protein [Mycobacterium sp.]|nr:glycosyltransferase family 39 protein [Mycobacterium sp.]
MTATARHRVALVVLLIATGTLYIWNLSASGWANSFYSAAVQAGSQNWTAFLFGSSDAANAITVDKTPGALWVMDTSVRLFGLNAWSVLVPQALEGVAAVALMYAAVRRLNGPAAGLLAGAVLALTPVATLIFRFNNPDALLVLLLVAAAYCVQRGCEKDCSRWWLPLAGAAVGFAFLAKMAQAFLVLPGFALAYLVTAYAPLRTRVWRALGAVVAMVLSGGWYLVVVALWPADRRPYIGGSQHNSVVELALGYNGFGRLTGNETGGLGNPNHDAGWGRLFDDGMGNEIAWLMPAAIICIAAALVITWHAPRTDAIRGAGMLWGTWLVVTGAVLSYSNGIIHPYYTVALAPAVAAAIGIGAPLLWRRRADIRAATALAGAVLLTAVLACVLLGSDASWLPWLRGIIAVAGVGAAVLLLVASRLPTVVSRAVAVVAAVACLAGPAAYSVATAATAHHGAIPGVGPSRGFGFGGFLDAPDVSPALVGTLTTDADRYTWTAATIGSTNAAGYQLATGTPVMAVGGFNGTDPAPTFEQFQKLVAAREIHYFIGEMRGPMRGGSGGSRESAEIASWVKANFPAHTVDDVTLYDLS